jgi:ABC-type nitrate/sulfonate/bicarbonate transport system permease component
MKGSKRPGFKQGADRLFSLLVVSAFFALWEALAKGGAIMTLFFPPPAKFSATFG